MCGSVRTASCASRDRSSASCRRCRTTSGSGGPCTWPVEWAWCRAPLLPADERSRLSENLRNAKREALSVLWQALAKRRVVVVLDNLDDLQDADTGELLDPDVALFLDSVCRAPVGQTVVTTSQRALRQPGDLGSHVWELELDAGLPRTTLSR